MLIFLESFWEPCFGKSPIYNLKYACLLPFQSHIIDMNQSDTKNTEFKVT